jgi:hypothetical protein
MSQEEQVKIVVPGGGVKIIPCEYEGLFRVLCAAFEQASDGKGKDRHCIGNEFFEDQVAVEGARRFSVGGPLFQAWKKIDEAGRMEPTPAIHELYGAINYCAAAIIVLEEQIEDSVAEIEDEDEITVTIDGVEVEDEEKVDLMTVDLSNMEPGESFKLNLNELGGDSELKTIHFRLV